MVFIHLEKRLHVERQGVSQMKKVHKGIVIGGGIGGLVAAIQLASKGIDMTLIDRNPQLGGKLQDITLGDYRFDFGPSTITMPWIFEQVFADAGEPLDPELVFVPLEINSRNFFSDGSVIDLSQNPVIMEEQLKHVSPANRKGYARYLQEVTKLYAIAEQHFFSRSFAEWTDFLSPKLGQAMMRVHPFTSMDRFHRQYFDDPRLLAMMNRYATYVGSSPYETPATIAMIAYLELMKGVYYIQGGNYRLIEAFTRLANKKGVRILSDTAIERILVEQQQVTGVQVKHEKIEADFVISNVDFYTTQLQLLNESERILPYSLGDLQKHVPLSSSGFLILAGVKNKFAQLEHHNLFFPSTYGQEFKEMFSSGTWPQQPAIYICNSSHHEPQRAKQGDGSNLYILMNVPADELSRTDTSSDEYGHHESKRESNYQQRCLDRLEHDWGLHGLSGQLEVSANFNPAHIAQLSGAPGGALYGAASHGFKPTFFRPTLKDKKIRGLYYAGGSTHPGGGTPMVTISGLQVAKKIAKDYRMS
jgi:phytoene desaturase